MPTFDDLVGRFWDRSSTYLVNDPLTQSDIAHAEQLLGVKLPSGYLWLLQAQNGGQTAADFRAHPSPIPTSWSDDHVPFEECFGIGSGYGSIMESPELSREWGQPAELVLLCGDGHWWIALDYRQCGPAGEPPVVWYDNEIGEDVRLAPDSVRLSRGFDQSKPSRPSSESRSSVWIENSEPSAASSRKC